MKRVVFLAGLVMAVLALQMLAAAPAAAGDGDDLKDMEVDVLKPFEEAEPGTVGISDVKAEQLKKADHLLIKETRPPEADDEERIDNFKEADIKVDKVKPFDKLDEFSRQTLPFATEKEFAGALEFQDLDDALDGKFDADKAGENLVQVNPRLREDGVPEGVGRAEREDTSSALAGLSASGEAPAGAGNAAGEEVRFGNRIGVNERTSAADLAHFAAPQDTAATAEEANPEDRENREAAEEGQRVLEFNRMVGSNEFNALVHGIAGATEPMSIESGSAFLDDRHNLHVQVNGMRNADGTPAADRRLGAGLACMDSGFIPAVGEQGDGFALDANGNANFTGRVDFAGRGCVAPIPMIMGEDGSFVAVGAAPPMDESMMMNEAAEF